MLFGNEITSNFQLLQIYVRELTPHFTGDLRPPPPHIELAALGIVFGMTSDTDAVH